MLMPYPFKTQILDSLKSRVITTFTVCLLITNSGYAYSSESKLDTIHKIQKLRIKDREQNSEQIQNKIKVYKKLSEDLKSKKETAKQLRIKKFRLLETIIFGENPDEITLAQRTDILRKNLDIIQRFIENDYPIERSARLETVKKLRRRLENTSLSPGIMEDFYNILHNEVKLSQEDRIKTETIVIFNDNVEVVTFNIGRIGYYFINEEKKMAGLFSLKRSQWKLIDFETYVDNFKNAIEIIENSLAERYIILPIEVLGKTNVE